ncbi:MAG: hypothetical protein NT062_03665, partial [Proteobacteria bacterium]|nr:hypothetical protein [Pseudomonadota bacterium]
RDLQIVEVAASHIKALRARVPNVIVRGVVPSGARLVLRRPNHPDLEIEAGVLVPQDPSDPSTDDRVHVLVITGTRPAFESAPITLAEGTQAEIELPAPAAPSVRAPSSQEIAGHQRRGYLLLAGGLQLLTGSVVYGLWQRDEALEAGCITVTSCVDDHNHNLRVWGSTLFATGITLTVAGVYYAFIQPARRPTARTTAFTPLITQDTIGFAWEMDL